MKVFIVLSFQEGTTVKELYNAIHKAIKNHPKDFELKADDCGEDKAVVWTYSSKYKQEVTFYAIRLLAKLENVV